MYLHNLKLWNFRQYGSSNSEKIELDNPDLSVEFNKRLNLLVGENNSGKSTIVDAIKYVVLTQSREWIKPKIDDFFVNDSKEPDKSRAEKIRIECIFKTSKEEEAKNFLEWLKIIPLSEDEVEYQLNVYLEGEIKNGNVYSDILAGSRDDGTRLDAGARDLLRATYLMPLRDADSELTPKRGSRLSQILSSYKTFQSNQDDNHEIQEILKGANERVRKYFETDPEGKNVLQTINRHLDKLIDDKEAHIDLSDPSLQSILEKLILNLGSLKEGLGSNNLLFIAAELLLLETGLKNAAKVALIEEVEAHLHPQAQLRLIEYLQNSDSFKDVQFILTTHSPNLASKIDLENLFICKQGNVFPMGNSHTQLNQNDYAFLERFLDVTKANLFFCDGLILVEGDAENIMLPIFANLLGINFPEHGISIVNMGSLSFMRYTKIFLRNSDPKMGISVSSVRDLDIKRKLDDSGVKVIQVKKDLNPENERNKLSKELTKQDVKGYISKSWTLEYEIAQSCLQDLFYQAVLVAEQLRNKDNSFVNIYNEEFKEEVNNKLDQLISDFNEDSERVAYEIYAHKILGRKKPDSDKGSTPISKAVIAQCFSKILNELDEEEKAKRKAAILNDDYLKYLVNTIEHVSGTKLWQGN
ncbi:MAG: AAA family ATPase [Balneolaceae bacterium]|nr:AAA family ATPase [Balneolaceae bacterium]